jgi:hypothetical protein
VATRHHFAIRFRDGRTHVFNEATPGTLRVGDRIKLIAGAVGGERLSTMLARLRAPKPCCGCARAMYGTEQTATRESVQTALKALRTCRPAWT